MFGYHSLYQPSAAFKLKLIGQLMAHQVDILGEI